MLALSKGLTFRGYTVFELTVDPKRLERGIKFILDQVKSGVFKPVIAKTFKLDDIVEAHKYMESNEQFGKIVVTT